MQDSAGGGGQTNEQLRTAGLALAAATAAAHLALTVVSLRRSCLRYGDLLHGLCLHAGLVGCLHSGLVVVMHSMLQAAERHNADELWRIGCKVYLFCRIFLPGLFLYLTAGIVGCFRGIRYPPRRCGQSCTRLGYLTAHCLPWAACSVGLLPVLVLHKEGTETALRTQGRCLLIERWAWLGPLSLLLGAPLMAELMLTCLLCAYKPYRSGSGSGDSWDAEDSAASSLSSDRDGGSRRGHRRAAAAGVRGVSNGVRPLMTSGRRAVVSSMHGGRYFSESRLLRGRPMRLARSLLLTLSLLQACTQLPHFITWMLQTVLRNLHSRQLIQQSAIDTLYWLHLAYFPLAGVLMTAFVLQLHRAFRITEVEIEKEIQSHDCGSGQSTVREVLQTTSMLTSL